MSRSWLEYLRHILDEIEAHNDEEIRLRLLREQPLLVDKSGVLVVRSAAVDDLEGIERRDRELRLAHLAQGADGRRRCSTPRCLWPL